MAEFDELDFVLRDSFARIAEPEASTGVADAIRSRVDAGDLGVSVATSTAPGWSAGPGLLGVLGILGAGAILVGGGLGAGAAILAPDAEPAAAAISVEAESVSAGVCPGGTGAAEFLAGEHVLVIARSDDSSHLAVRSSDDWATPVWVPTGVVIVEPGQDAIDSLPVAGCPVVTAEPIEPEPEPEPEPEESEEPQPGPGPDPGPSDTTAPTIQQWWASETTLYNNDPAFFDTIISGIASDNIGVTSVRVNWTGPVSGNAQMSKAGGEWQYSFVLPNGAPEGVLVFRLVARDAAGNESPPVFINIDVVNFG